MSSLKIRRVIFAGQEEDIIGMIKRPIAWPSFKFHSSTLSDMLTKISQWRMVVEEKRCNKGTFLIARSVTMEDRRQSYVAAGEPSWLCRFFSNEAQPV